MSELSVPPSRPVPPESQTSGERFAWPRFLAVLIKEFIQMRRDRLTFAMMVGVPLMQLTLFGFAINSDPKALPTAVFMPESSLFSRSFLQALENSGYFRINGSLSSPEEGARQLATGAVQFVIQFPDAFAERLLRGERPPIAVAADATDPAATGGALAALQNAADNALGAELTGPSREIAATPSPVEIRIHRYYNPENITQYNIVPGLIGVILTMTMVILTAIAMTRERERGTMESLLAMPVRPVEVMLGKIIPYSLIGCIQVSLVLLAARFLFMVPIQGSLILLGVCLSIFIIANLALGFAFSTIARNQLQAMQMSTFFFLPSILLSGFMFPFRGMPFWAQMLGELLPLTHCLRIIRGILLKGNGFMEVAPELAALVVFLLAALALALFRYRETLE